MKKKHFMERIQKAIKLASLVIQIILRNLKRLESLFGVDGVQIFMAEEEKHFGKLITKPYLPRYTKQRFLIAFPSTRCKNMSESNAKKNYNANQYMVLDAQTRGTLEHFIDGFIQIIIPNLVKPLFYPQQRSRWHIQNQNDFSTGFALGIILSKFLSCFHSIYGRNPNKEEISEAVDIIYRRTAGIKVAISKVG
jgi:hypothetical protein